MNRIKIGPRITHEPRSKRLTTNKSVYFICQVTGDPTPVILWLRNGEIVDGKNIYELFTFTIYIILGSHDSNLYVYTGGDRSFLYLRRPLLSSKSGVDEFICLGKNKYGTVRSRPAYLRIVE